MVAQLKQGIRSWSGTVEDNGDRTYKVKHLVKADYDDGPSTVLVCINEAYPAGSAWSFGNDYDEWAWCRPTRELAIHQEREGDKNKWWVVTSTFSTKKPSKEQAESSRCADEQIEDPLLMPPKLSGTFNQVSEEATHDRHDERILNSAFEQMRGQQVEFERPLPTVHIELNVPTLEYDLLMRLAGALNDAPMWGFPTRCVRLSSVQWSSSMYGLCYIYYTWVLDFEINVKWDYDNEVFVSGWDRDLLDEGTKVLDGYWDTDEASPTFGEYIPNVSGPGVELDPSNFIRFQDKYGNPSRVVLNGAGMPVGAQGDPDEEPGSIHVEKYQEDDLLQLNIPTEIG